MEEDKSKTTELNYKVRLDTATAKVCVYGIESTAELYFQKAYIYPQIEVGYIPILNSDENAKSLIQEIGLNSRIIYNYGLEDLGIIQIVNRLTEENFLSKMLLENMEVIKVNDLSKIESAVKEHIIDYCSNPRFNRLKRKWHHDLENVFLENPGLDALA